MVATVDAGPRRQLFVLGEHVDVTGEIPVQTLRLPLGAAALFGDRTVVELSGQGYKVQLHDAGVNAAEGPLWTVEPPLQADQVPTFAGTILGLAQAIGLENQGALAFDDCTGPVAEPSRGWVLIGGAAAQL